MERLALVCLGGALGSGARYLVSAWTNERLGPAFAWGTLAVNVLGSFAAGFAVRYASESARLPPSTILFLTTGVLGGFTTYSTFNQETLNALDAGRAAWALANVLATVVACLAAGFAGQAVARALASGA